jgi:glycine/D-amino acid oxidase-like deaminating enzyme
MNADAITSMRVDVAIVGSGIVGCLIARELVDRYPTTSVLVLDRENAGSGASRRSAGVHFPRGATRRVREMSAFSHRYYERLVALQPQVPIHPLAMTVISAEMDDDGIHEIYLDEACLERADPPDGGERRSATTRAWRGTGSHYADVGALVTTLVRQPRPGVRYAEGVAVTAVEPAERDVRLGLSTGTWLRATAAVLAPGPWLGTPAWAPLLASFGTRVKKVVALHVDRCPEPDDPLIVFHDDDSFLLPARAHSRWLFSYTNHDWDVDPDDIHSGLAQRDLAAGLDCLSRHAPRLVDHVAGGRVFCDAYSPDREPIVSPVPGHPHVVFAGATNGSGYRLAPAIAARVVDLLPIEAQQRIHR